MKLNTDSNLYIFVYSSLLVIVVAAGLSFTAVRLQDDQEKNIRAEKMQNILQSAGLNPTRDNAEELFNKYIKEDFVVNLNGEKIEGRGFDVNMKTQAKEAVKINRLNKKIAKIEAFLKKKPDQEKSKNDTLSGIIEVPSYAGWLPKMMFNPTESEKKSLQVKLDSLESLLKLPVYIFEKEGKKSYIFPLQGKGLWGPIWGYLALEGDFNTISGAVFDHKAETPGLGADINKDWFEKPFKGKLLFEGDEFVSITVHKGGTGAAKIAGDETHGVDAISGGTITSKALESMLKDDWLYSYKGFLKKNKK